MENNKQLSIKANQLAASPMAIFELLKENEKLKEFKNSIDSIYNDMFEERDGDPVSTLVFNEYIFRVSEALLELDK